MMMHPTKYLPGEPALRIPSAPVPCGLRGCDRAQPSPHHRYRIIADDSYGRLPSSNGGPCYGPPIAEMFVYSLSRPIDEPHAPHPGGGSPSIDPESFARTERLHQNRPGVPISEPWTSLGQRTMEEWVWMKPQRAITPCGIRSSRCNALAALLTTACQHTTSATRRHSGTEPDGALSFEFGGLIGSFHGISLLCKSARTIGVALSAVNRRTSKSTG
jgi:hypothetical protein